MHTKRQNCNIFATSESSLIYSNAIGNNRMNWVPELELRPQRVRTLHQSYHNHHMASRVLYFGQIANAALSRIADLGVSQ